MRTFIVARFGAVTHRALLSFNLPPMIGKLTFNHRSEAVSIISRSYRLARRGGNQPAA